jgi:NO-binding membrane sensor protein with MHYT domain
VPVTPGQRQGRRRVLGPVVLVGLAPIAMLGFSIPGQAILYNVPLTLGSMVLAIVVVGAGLFIVGYGDGSRKRLLAGGVIVGLGVASMHYIGMAAMHVYLGAGMAMSGVSGGAFLLPMVVGISLVSLILTIVISLSPSEDEMAMDARVQQNLAELEHKQREQARQGGDFARTQAVSNPPGRRYR